MQNPVVALPAPPPPEAAIALIPGIFNVRQIRVTGPTIANSAESRQVLAFADGGPNVTGWTIAVDQRDLFLVASRMFARLIATS